MEVATEEVFSMVCISQDALMVYKALGNSSFCLQDII